jgi:hypothetical protein
MRRYITRKVSNVSLITDPIKWNMKVYTAIGGKALQFITEVRSSILQQTPPTRVLYTVCRRQERQ